MGVDLVLGTFSSEYWEVQRVKRAAKVDDPLGNETYPAIFVVAEIVIFPLPAAVFSIHHIMILCLSLTDHSITTLFCNEAERCPIFQ